MRLLTNIFTAATLVVLAWLLFTEDLKAVAILLLVIAGIWIAETMAEMRRTQDCFLSGRRNCAPIPLPPSTAD